MFIASIQYIRALVPYTKYWAACVPTNSQSTRRVSPKKLKFFRRSHAGYRYPVIHKEKIMAYQYPFSNEEEVGKQAVWNKGRKIIQNGKEHDPSVWRWDICGKVMKYSEHGNTNSDNGWEIDHIKSSEKGGSGDLSNLQPLQWENNRTKSDTYPWSC